MATVNIVDMLKNYKSSEGISLFDHLCNLFNKIAHDKSRYANFEQFEILSDFVKKNQYVHKTPKTAEEVNNIKEIETESAEWIVKLSNLLSKYVIDGKKPVAECGAVPNIVLQSRLLEWAGIYFGEEETYALSKSLAKLALRTKAYQVRFWGKILGSQKDYYVAEGVTSNLNNDEFPREVEPKGTGINKLSFWVTDNVFEEWIELPVITPDQMKTSRLIKYIFTGNLNQKINSYPLFKGLEKHLLKAQLVRISYSTVIEPKGLHKINDDNQNEVDYEEEYKHPEFTELSNLETWVHSYSDILKAGRVSHLAPADLPEEEQQAKLDEMNTDDPVTERLKGINEDKPFEPFEQGWLVKTVGDTQQFNLVGKEEGVTSYAVVVLKNLRWPGSVTVTNNKTYANIYVGYGLKNGQPSFFPNQPQEILEEADDIDEQPEPNPKHEIVEPDSDDLKKKEEGEEGDGGEEGQEEEN